jgi:uncharacterized protein YijF (DUF1287 family)
MTLRSAASRLTLLCLLLAGPGAHASPPDMLVAAARTQIGVTVDYDPRYERLAFPNGDVPMERGVCTDVIVRAYRKLGVDLQALVNQDMRRAWSAYPKQYGLKRPDPNIDHRRVPNLQTFLRRQGSALPLSTEPGKYQPGDVVTWRLPGNLTHIGLVSDQQSPRGVPLIIHNIGRGARLEDMLFAYEVTGHYRWAGPAARAP